MISYPPARPDIAFVVHTKPSQKIELELLCPQVSELFREVRKVGRKVAFEQGRGSVPLCGVVFEGWFGGWVLDYAGDVMEEEFGVGVGDLRRALKEMQELQDADEFHRPPLLFPMSSGYPEWKEIFLETDARFGGKFVLERPLSETWEIKMGDCQVKRVPGIWDSEGKTRVLGP